MRVIINQNENENTQEEVGFTTIYIPDGSCPAELIPGKTPYVIFQMPFWTRHDINYYKKNKQLVDLGTWSIENKTLTLVVTGNAKIVKAIDLFTSMNEYHNDANGDVFSSLSKLREKCETVKAEKDEIAPKKLPPKSRPLAEFESENQPQLQSYNPTSQWREKDNPEEKYIFKENVTGRPISEIEAFNGLCYQLLLGKRHPEVSSVHKGTEERAGLISKVIPGFISMNDYVDKHGLLSASRLIKSEVAKIWVAAFVEEEADLHGSNYGFDDSGAGYAVKIDDDRSTWPLTSKYLHVDPARGQGPESDFPTPPLTDFAVSVPDIASFPLLAMATPNRWPDRGVDAENFEENALIDLSVNKKFIEDKYYMFLKRVLIPDSAYESIGMATIGSDNTRNKYVRHKCGRTEELTSKLLEDPGFRNYVNSNPGVINQMITEFTEYNDNFSNDEDRHLRVDLSVVKNTFANICQQANAARDKKKPEARNKPKKVRFEDEQDSGQATEQSAVAFQMPKFNIEIAQPDVDAAIGKCLEMLSYEKIKLQIDETDISLQAKTILANNCFNIFMNSMLLFAIKTLLDNDGNLKPEIYQSLKPQNIEQYLDKEKISKAEKKRKVAVPEDQYHKYISESVKKELIKAYVNQAVNKFSHESISYEEGSSLQEICINTSNALISRVPAINKKLVKELNRDYGDLVPVNKSDSETNKLINAIKRPGWHRFQTDLADTSDAALGAYVGGITGTVGGAVLGGLIAGAVIGGVFTGPLAPVGIVVGACIGAVAGLAVGFLMGPLMGVVVGLAKRAIQGLIKRIKSSSKEAKRNDSILDMKIKLTAGESSSKKILSAGKRAVTESIPGEGVKPLKQKEIETETATRKSGGGLFHPPEKVRRDSSKMDFSQIIMFLKEKNEFFAAMVKNGNSFLVWAGYNELHHPGITDQFQEFFDVAFPNATIKQAFLSALVGNDEDDKKCLLFGNSQAMRSLLFENPRLDAALRSFIDDPIVDEWYEDQRVFKVSNKY